MRSRVPNCLIILLIFVFVFFLAGYIHFKDVTPSFELSNPKTLHLLPTNNCIAIQPNELILKGCKGLVSTEIAMRKLPTEGRKKDCIKSEFVITRPDNPSNAPYFTGIYIKSTDKAGFNEVRIGIDELKQVKIQFYLDEELVEERKKVVELPEEMSAILEMTSARHYSYFGPNSILFSIKKSNFSGISNGFGKIKYASIGAFTGEKTIGLFLETLEENAEVETRITDFIIRKDWASQD